MSMHAHCIICVVIKDSQLARVGWWRLFWTKLYFTEGKF